MNFKGMRSAVLSVLFVALTIWVCFVAVPMMNRDRQAMQNVEKTLQDSKRTMEQIEKKLEESKATIEKANADLERLDKANPDPLGKLPEDKDE
jgi:peptidoglycan hydrolase CwlO-like protein